MATSTGIEQVTVRDVTILRFAKQRLYDSDKIEELTAALLEIADNLQTDKVIMNLSGVDYFSSSGIGALIRFAKRLAQNHVQLRLSDLQPMVEEIMFLQRLHQVFDIQTDEATALMSFE